MKISFVIDNKIAVLTWKEIKQYKGDLLITYENYQKFKSLELNKDFEEVIVESRKNLNIPIEGIPWKEFLENEEKLRKDSILELKKMTREKLAFHDFAIFMCLDGILYSNCVFPEIFVTDREKISFRFDDQDLESGIPESVLIAIENPISKNQLINFIKDNWDGDFGIESEIKKLNFKKDFKISKRDFRIAELKSNNPKKTFKEIADQIVNEFDIEYPDDLKINEFSVKTANDRVIEKAKSLVRKIK